MNTVNEFAKRTIYVRNALGLHARACASVISLVWLFPRNEFNGLRLHDEKRYNLRSIMDLLMVAVRAGDSMELEVEGPKAAEIASTIKEFIEHGLFRTETKGFLGDLIDRQEITNPGALAEALVKQRDSDIRHWINETDLQSVIDDLSSGLSLGNSEREVFKEKLSMHLKDMMEG